MLVATPILRPLLTSRVTRGASRCARDLGFCVLEECRLGNGRRADLMGLDAKGQIIIVEVKSCVEDFNADNKWQDYLDYCDAFYFAVPEGFPLEVIPADCGLIVADAFGGECLRSPTSAGKGVSPARRKAMTVMLARLGAERLTSVVYSQQASQTFVGSFTNRGA